MVSHDIHGKAFPHLPEICHMRSCSNSDCSCMHRRGKVLENESFWLAWPVHETLFGIDCISSTHYFGNERVNLKKHGHQKYLKQRTFFGTNQKHCYQKYLKQHTFFGTERVTQNHHDQKYLKQHIFFGTERVTQKYHHQKYLKQHTFFRTERVN